MSEIVKKCVMEGVKEMWPEAGILEGEIFTEVPDGKMGDVSVPVFGWGKKVGKSPNEIAESLSKFCEQSGKFMKVEAISGFVNFWLRTKDLFRIVDEILEKGEKFGESGKKKAEKIMVEFAHPNSHKAFHVGHFRNIALGESLVRILEKQEAEIFRGNYQGDVGPHVAKCLWGILQDEKGLSEMRKGSADDLEIVKERAEWLGKKYAIGAQKEGIEDEIKKLNKQVYQRDPEIFDLWKETRQWSLDYFEKVIYKKVGSHFDKCFFESEVWERGLEIAKELLKKGILEESEGAVIFSGDKVGLHKRVFVTQEGNPTYEAKDLGLAELERKTFEFERNVHVVGNEQAGYFKVMFEVLGEWDDWQKGKQEHLSYGMVNLKSGKMSSRTGEVLTADWLLDEVGKRVEVKMKESGNLKKGEEEKIAEMVTVGAAKFAMLKVAAKKDIDFDFETSVSFVGDSGPYLQYAHARICSIFREAGKVNLKNVEWGKMEKEQERELVKKLGQFEKVILKAGEKMDPSLICSFLIEVAQNFSRFYAVCPVLKAENEELKKARLALCGGTKIVLKEGLRILGIGAPERM